ncbi:DUF2589 domain-containing protein [Salmonella enterica]|nr:DUF2589 domain-containing protein [Salmonella enterica]EBV4143490.1 DUF2589 domain-containing protein [Salmonella enterica subsp. enterica serovar Benin]ECG5862809.1 DUF2589 domain-containing protein [Salmonella enterica subsp. enterica serovar Oranienburg]EIC0165243.1 DUF2589 domain-containing protein [Salmonella enterica subsp. enterica serovar Kinondoni]EBE6989559.1 DUF2589 domain-containing protein [Salmonella enterica]
MAGEIANQFNGLPINSLIGAPLMASCEAQEMMAKSTADFINRVGFKDNQVRNVKFLYTQKTPEKNGNTVTVKNEEMEINVPLLSIVNIPSLLVKKVDITFDMEVKSAMEEKSSSDTSAEASAGGGLFGWGVKIKGNVSTHKESTRKTDNSAKYHIEVHAADEGMPEGLSRVLDILQTSIQPVPVNAQTASQVPASQNTSGGTNTGGNTSGTGQ